MPIPKMTEANISPAIRVFIVTGVAISRSRVRACASQGWITGETAVAVKKTVIARRPDSRNGIDNPRSPTANARKRKSGMKRPKMTTGLLHSRSGYPSL